MTWKKRGHKYAAVAVKDEDGYFPSKKEHRRWQQLKMLEDDGQISHLTRIRKDCTFELHGQDGSIVCRYIADFIYVEGGVKICEDAKGMKTDVYKIKLKFLKAEYKDWVHRES